MQEMTGRKPEGGDERKTFSCSTYKGSCNIAKTPWCFLKHALFLLYLPIVVWNEMRGTLGPFSTHSSTLILGINTQE